MVSGVIEGFNATVLAYGQTGAGKTFTMTGSTQSYEHRGLVPRAVAHVFQEAEKRHDASVAVRISYLELYNEQMYDLLAFNTDAPDLQICETKGGATRVHARSRLPAARRTQGSGGAASQPAANQEPAANALPRSGLRGGERRKLPRSAGSRGACQLLLAAGWPKRHTE